jgi:hypothetical protein
MKKPPLGLLIPLMLALPLCGFADASASSVGLGFSIGGAVPTGNLTGITTMSGVLSFNWGFYVDIPLISTFHITPSSELYKFADQNATDFDLAFKFIVPLGSMDVFAGVVPGLTAVSNVLALHLGALAGASFSLVSNLSAFVQGKWDLLFDPSQNVNVFHLTAGILFAF